MRCCVFQNIIESTFHSRRMIRNGIINPIMCELVDVLCIGFLYFEFHPTDVLLSVSLKLVCIDECAIFPKHVAPKHTTTYRTRTWPNSISSVRRPHQSHGRRMETHFFSHSPDTQHSISAPRKNRENGKQCAILFTNMFWSGDMNAFVSGPCIMSWCRLQWWENGWMWARESAWNKGNKVFLLFVSVRSHPLTVPQSTEASCQHQLHATPHTTSPFSTKTCNLCDSIDLMLSKTHSNHITFGIWFASCTVVVAISLHRWCEESKSRIMHKRQKRKKKISPLPSAESSWRCYDALSQTDRAIQHFCGAYTVMVYYDFFMVHYLSKNEIRNIASMQSVRRSISFIDFPFVQNINQWLQLEQFFFFRASRLMSTKKLLIHSALCSVLTYDVTLHGQTGVMGLISWKWRYSYLSIWSCII